MVDSQPLAAKPASVMYVTFDLVVGQACGMRSARGLPGLRG